MIAWSWNRISANGSPSARRSSSGWLHSALWSHASVCVVLVDRPMSMSACVWCSPMGWRCTLRRHCSSSTRAKAYRRLHAASRMTPRMSTSRARSQPSQEAAMRWAT